jgi:hypothetical protein
MHYQISHPNLQLATLAQDSECRLAEGPISAAGWCIRCDSLITSKPRGSFECPDLPQILMLSCTCMSCNPYHQTPARAPRKTALQNICTLRLGEHVLQAACDMCVRTINELLIADDHDSSFAFEHCARPSPPSLRMIPNLVSHDFTVTCFCRRSAAGRYNNGGHPDCMGRDGLNRLMDDQCCDQRHWL